MFCKNCGKEIMPNAVICVGCGVKVGDGSNYCANCGQQIAPAAGMTAEQVAEYGQKKYGKKLCIKCGKEAGAAQAEQPKAETK